MGRPSIAPEKLLRALLLQVLYTIRSERLLMEQLDYNLLFRWFVGLNMDDAVWVPTVFSKNRDRLLEGDIARRFSRAWWSWRVSIGCCPTSTSRWMGRCWRRGRDRRVSGARMAASEPPDGRRSNPDVNFHGEKRSNATHESTTDPDARLSKKGAGKKPS